jgi:hypothetical protein
MMEKVCICLDISILRYELKVRKIISIKVILDKISN